ncbi:MAG TPA: sporulation protein YabP [Limnochordia bacterium]
MGLPARPGRPDSGREPHPGRETRERAMHHQLTLQGREALAIDGIVHVESFDDKEVTVETSQGTLRVQGSDLSIKELNLESGTLALSGFIVSLEYTKDATKRRQALLRRLFK